MDKYRIRQLAKSAQRRAEKCHREFQEYQPINSEVAASRLNDYFYWIGHANAYKGILAGLEIQEMVEAEIDNTPSCP
jgi:hypothetical protein